MFYGTRITFGLQSWQVVQTYDGTATVKIGGSWRLEEGAKKAGVSSVTPEFRLAREDDNSLVYDWKAADGFTDKTWETELKLPRGGLYRLETCLDAVSAKTGEHWRFRGDIRTHIGAGDVFAVAGQSNAAGYGSGVAFDPPDMMVHVLRNSGNWDMAVHPLNDATDAPDCPNAPMGQTGTSPFISFGRAYAGFTGAPVGLIACAQGGSAIRQWDARQGGVLNLNMIRRIKKAGGAKAVLWYQGCTEALESNTVTYAEQFRYMVDETRKALGYEIPYYTFQLNRYDVPHDFDAWNTIRQTQTDLAREMKKVYLLPTTGMELGDEIHNSSAANVALGEELARLICKGAAAPLAEEVCAEGRQIRVKISLLKGELRRQCNIRLNECFRAQDDSGIIEITQVTFGGDTITLELSRPAQGDVFVSYDMEEAPFRAAFRDSATLLPVIPFYRVKAEQRR
ncbi:MAG: sialate O-acetylesterase [Clostridiales bacterium]|nr:sialate O-acetylesterase [Clostridiales bacterium]